MDTTETTDPYFEAALELGYDREQIFAGARRVIDAVRRDAGDLPRVAAAVRRTRERLAAWTDPAALDDVQDLAGALVCGLCEAYYDDPCRHCGAEAPERVVGEAEARVHAVAVSVLREQWPEAAALVDARLQPVRDVEHTDAWAEWRARDGSTATTQELDFVRGVAAGYAGAGYIITPGALELLARAARTKRDELATADTYILAGAALQACRRADA